MRSLKKIISMLMVVVLCMGAVAFAENGEVTVTLNGAEMVFEDVKPQIIADRTMVPLRAIFDAVGATVTWDEETRSILSNKDDVVIMLQIDNDKMFKNSEVVTLDSPPVIVNDRTLVPIRAIAESFGLKVDWNEAERTVIINNITE